MPRTQKLQQVDVWLQPVLALLIAGQGLHESIRSEGYPFCQKKSPGHFYKEMSLYGQRHETYLANDRYKIETGVSEAAVVMNRAILGSGRGKKTDRHAL